MVDSRLNSAVYVYSLPDLKLLGSVDVGRAPDWVTLTPDGKTAYVANAGLELRVGGRSRARSKK